jgi:hypothetical protein
VLLAVGIVEMAFPLGGELIEKIREARFLEKYIGAACSINSSEAMIQCFELVKRIAKVGFDQDFLILLPVFAGLLGDPTGGWQAFVISMLATLSRYEQMQTEIRRNNLVEKIVGVIIPEPTVMKQKAKFCKHMGLSEA